MKLYPAIDLYGGKAVRLFKGDYQQMTVYSENPLEIALDFQKAGARYIHLVDLEGAKFGTTPNLSVIRRIVEATDLFVEVGGGIRSMDDIEKIRKAGEGRIHFTVGSALDLYGGTMSFDEICAAVKGEKDEENSKDQS